jgi:hypothetical protein
MIGRGRIPSCGEREDYGSLGKENGLSKQHRDWRYLAGRIIPSFPTALQKDS